MKTTRGLVPLLGALVAVPLLFWSFVSGISDALSGNGTGNLIWQIVFVLAALLVLASIAFAIVNIVKKRAAVFSVATLFVAAIPIVMIAIIAVMASMPGN